MDLSFNLFIRKEDILLQPHELLRYLLHTDSQIMQKDQFTFIKLLDILSVVVLSTFVLAIQLVQIDFYGFVGVPSVLGCA